MNSVQDPKMGNAFLKKVVTFHFSGDPRPFQSSLSKKVSRSVEPSKCFLYSSQSCNSVLERLAAHLNLLFSLSQKLFTGA